MTTCWMNTHTHTHTHTRRDLASGGIVVLVGDGAFRQLLPAAPAGLRERPTELVREDDVVTAAAPPEVALRLVTWHRSAATADRRAGTARLGDGVSQRRARQRVDERLLTAPCNHTTPQTSYQLHSTAYIDKSLIPRRCDTSRCPDSGLAASVVVNISVRDTVSRRSPAFMCNYCMQLLCNN